jgi:hypothetical protein
MAKNGNPHPSAEAPKKKGRGGRMIYSVKEAISSARQGDATAAKWLINEFCATVNENRQKTPEGEFKLTSDGERIPHLTPSGTHTQFDEALLNYLVGCFEKIGNFEGEPGSPKRVNADVALNLAGFSKRGRKSSPKTKEESRRRGLAAWKMYKDSGKSLEHIFVELAKTEEKSVGTIERDYKDFKKLLKPRGK